MPYIHKGLRKRLDDTIDELIGLINHECGDEKYDQNLLPNLKAGTLNYTFTRLLKTLKGEAWNYERFNRAIGVLESCKQEFYRRNIAPYEDKKIIENGDVNVL